MKTTDERTDVEYSVLRKLSRTIEVHFSLYSEEGEASEVNIYFSDAECPANYLDGWSEPVKDLSRAAFRDAVRLFMAKLPRVPRSMTWDRFWDKYGTTGVADDGVLSQGYGIEGV